MWMPHLPGQHYDVRLTAPDGYQAQRSYSVASSPLDEGEIELTIDRLGEGEVSPYFHDVVEVGDQVEVRGPFASYFVWRGEAPVLLVGGGSGRGPAHVDPAPPAPHHARAAHAARLLGPLRRGRDLRGRAGRGDGAHLHARAPGRVVRATPGASTRRCSPRRRRRPGTAFVCGTNGFVETAVGAAAATRATRPSGSAPSASARAAPEDSGRFHSPLDRVRELVRALAGGAKSQRRDQLAHAVTLEGVADA